MERCSKWWNKGGSRILYPYGCCKETSDKVVVVYKSYIRTPFYSELLPRDRFLQLLSNMHFANNADDDGTDRLFKIQHVVETIISNFRETFTPYQNIATDESLLKFHGRLEFKHYNPSKRARFDIKFYKVFQSSGPAAGYTWNKKIYCGQDRTYIVVKIEHILWSRPLQAGYTWNKKIYCGQDRTYIVVKTTASMRCMLIERKPKGYAISM